MVADREDIRICSPLVAEKLQWLQATGYRPGITQETAEQFLHIGVWLANSLREGPQLIIALQHIVDALDAAIRQATVDVDNQEAEKAEAAAEELRLGRIAVIEEMRRTAAPQAASNGQSADGSAGGTG